MMKIMVPRSFSSERLRRVVAAAEEQVLEIAAAKTAAAMRGDFEAFAEAKAAGIRAQERLAAWRRLLDERERQA